MKFKDMEKMSLKKREEILNELRFELIKTMASPQKTNKRTKEIKKAIARLITLANVEKNRKMRQK